jgi:cytochrome c-type biogenesis protein CcmH
MGVVIPPILFWPAAAVLAALCAVLVLARGARAARGVDDTVAEDPARAVYRRQLQDIDELVDRGVLAEEERNAAQAEAARRLLAEPGAPAERKGQRIWPLAAAVAAALAALGLYLWIGSPGAPDQPYRARLERWKTTPISGLRPDEVAAVLREVAKDHPNDPKLMALLGRVERAAGDPVAASQALTRSARLDPNDADVEAALGEALAAASGNKPTPEAEAALNRALQIDPKNQAALYYLGGAKAADGDTAEAARLWRQLASELPDSDVRKPQLMALADQVEKGPAAAAPAAAGDQAGFIRGMVASLQARLDANPNDPAGWARLVRSYKVLGDKPAEDKALARARSLFANRPADLKSIEAEAQ